MKTYLYKYFSSTSASKGIVQNVISDFSLSQEINRAGGQLELAVEGNINDRDPTAEYDTLVDENANYVIDENSNNIVTGVEYTLTGVPILGDRLEAWEFSEFNPDGVRKFNGLVTKWSYDDAQRKTNVTALSYGVRLDNKIVEILPGSVFTSNLATDGTESMQALDYDPSTTTTYFAQTFQSPSDVDLITINLKMTVPSSALSGNTAFLLSHFPPKIYIKLYSGTPTGVNSYIAGGYIYAQFEDVDIETDIAFTFSSGKPITAGSTYYFYIYHEEMPFAPTIINLAVDNSANYSSGTRYSYVSGSWVDQSDDMWFSIISSTGAIGNTFNSYDPSAIVEEALDLFIASGGEISYNSSTIDSTGTNVSYIFRFNTYLDLIQKCVELAPANYYWFVDPASNLLYFKQRATSADHILIKGTHFITYSLERSLEDVKNLVYFSGGDDGSGTNLMDSTSNSESISSYGSWVQTITDTRVTDPTSAEILMDSVLLEKAYPEFRIELFIRDTYDDSTFLIGQIVQLRNTNPIVDSLLLQIQSMRQTKAGTYLSLGQLTPTQNKRIEDVKRNLRLLESANNPDSS